MAPTLNDDGWLQSLVMVLSLLVLFVVGTDLNRALPNTAVFIAPRRSELIPTRRIEALFSPAAVAQLSVLTNRLNPFYSTSFQTTPSPPVTTRKVELTYQGFYETAQGQKQAFVKVGDHLVIGYIGTKVVADLVVADILMRRLVLSNGFSQSNVLEFNIKKDIDVPVR